MAPPSTPPASDTTAMGGEARRRYHAFDALRATALLLGVALHAGLAYLPGDQVGWAVQDRSTSLAFAIGLLVIHAFRLPLFFLLAGFFARLVVERRGTTAFVRDQVRRILVPFVLGWFLVLPFVAFAWIWGRMMHADPALAGSALRLGFGELLNQLGKLRHVAASGGEFTLTHLWFLYVLLQLYALFLVGRGAGRRLLDPGGRLTAQLDRAVRTIADSAWLLPVLAVSTAVVLLGMRHWGIDTPDRSLLPHPPVLLLYGGIFTLGWWLQRQTDLLESFVARAPWFLLIGGLAVLPVAALAGLEWQTGRPSYYAWARGTYVLLYAAMLWAWVLGLLGLFGRTCRRESRVWRYLSDASYWIYIVHLPLVCAGQVWLSRGELSCWTKFGLNLAAALIVSVASYHLLVRSTPVGLLLNGRRHPFRWRFQNHPGTRRSTAVLQ